MLFFYLILAFLKNTGLFAIELHKALFAGHLLKLLGDYIQ